VRTTGAAVLAGLLPLRALATALASRRPVVALIGRTDPVAASPVARWALGRLEAAVAERGGLLALVGTVEEIPADAFVIVLGGPTAPAVAAAWRALAIAPPSEPEALGLAPARVGARAALVATGADERGLAYALTELADRVRCAPEERAAWEIAAPLVERPASRVRSVLRGFNSEQGDKPWFHDRDYWHAYLDMLAESRLNRLHFALGMGYNLAQNITDGYLLFPYPFLLDVPGHTVRARGLPADERAANLATLRFVADECARRGLEFHLGLWTLAYDWPRSPDATYRIEGLTEANHAAYCRDALALLLREVPGITGITFRVHEESGIPRGQEGGFWAAQFHPLAGCGRRVGLDLHAKSMSPEVLRLAVATGQAVTISPKFGGEHQPLPYHQAAVRRFEQARPGAVTDPGEGVLTGDRGFTRYGYADSLAENRTWDVHFRIWPGTQRFLLGADPALLAGYGRAAAFCGAAGVELSEPLFFRGRRGSGGAGERCDYADPALAPARDFEKYRHLYRLWGRLGYAPDTAPAVWRRALRIEFGEAAPALEHVLAAAGRVLPLITTAHAPSADCVRYWPEVYSDIPLAEAAGQLPYYDSLPPVRFGNVSPLDPQLFLSPDEWADALLVGPATGKYSPLEVAAWLEAAARQITESLGAARTAAGAAAAHASFRRVEEDALIQEGLARFFAAKFRAAVLWRIHLISGNRQAGATAVQHLAAAGELWAAMATRAGRIYRRELGYGEGQSRGHWLDRLPAIERDVAEVRRELETSRRGESQLHQAPAQRALREIAAGPVRPHVEAAHTPPAAFSAGQPLPLELRVSDPAVTAVRVHHRPVNHAEAWAGFDLERAGEVFRGAIPARGLATRFPLQYYFEIFVGPAATLYPGLGSDLTGQPYYVVRRAT
jgi:hypothetical protein